MNEDFYDKMIPGYRQFLDSLFAWMHERTRIGGTGFYLRMFTLNNLALTRATFLDIRPLHDAIDEALL